MEKEGDSLATSSPQRLLSTSQRFIPYSFTFNIIKLNNFQLVSDIQTRKSEASPPLIPKSWISEDFIVRCFERKGGIGKGKVSTHREDWGREGVKEVSKITLIYWLIR